MQQPTKLAYAGNNNTTTEQKCDSNLGCGVTRTFTYQIQDQLSPSNPVKAHLDFYDGIQTVSGQNGCNLTSYTTSCPQNQSCLKLTAADGTFPENLPICAPACLAGQTCRSQCGNGPTHANQTWTINGYVLTSDIKALTFNCSQVLVNGQ